MNSAPKTLNELSRLAGQVREAAIELAYAASQIQSTYRFAAYLDVTHAILDENQVHADGQHLKQVSSCALRALGDLHAACVAASVQHSKRAAA